MILKSGNRLRKVFLILEGAARGYLVGSERDEKTILLRGKGIFVGDAQGVFMNSMKEAILRLTYRVESMITMSSEERYLDLLKMNPAFLKNSYDKYVANFLGITPVSLSRVKKKLNLSN